MLLQRTISLTEDNDSVQQRADAYMLAAGYRKVASGPSPLTYQRGSSLGSLAGFSPRGWQVTAQVNPAPQEQSAEAHVTLDINSTGQVVTPGDRLFWAAELDGLEHALKTGEVSTSASIETAQTVLLQKIIGAVLMPLLVLVLALLVTVATGSMLIGLAAGIVGLLVGFAAVGFWMGFVRTEPK